MNATAHTQQPRPERSKPDLSQIVKWTVYTLLLINFGFYFFEELEIASHTLRNGGAFLDWTREFATTIDEIAWLSLLLLFEAETYILSDETLDKPSVRWPIHGIRLLCYVFLAHTVYARATTVNEFENMTPATEVTSLCQLADRDISFGMNYVYTVITPENCEALSGEQRFYYTDETVVTDSEGYALERKLVWIDLNDAVMWLLVVWAIELAVWLQSRDITGGVLMLVSRAARIIYAILFTHAAIWAWYGHWVWAWDEFLWIVGFWAIELNLSEWRDEIRSGPGESAERRLGPQ